MGAVWAAGFTVVPLLLGAVAQASSPAVAFPVSAALCLPSMLVLVWCVRRLGGRRRPRRERSRDTGTVSP